MSRIFDRTFGATVDHRWAVGLLILALTVLAVLGYMDPQRLTRLFKSPAPPTAVTPQQTSRTYEEPPDVDPVSLSDPAAIPAGSRTKSSEDRARPTGRRLSYHTCNALRR